MAHLLLWSGVWLLPMIGYGAANTTPRFLQAELRVFYRLSALFTKRSNSWGDYHAQGRVGPEAGWVTLNLADYDSVMVWGYGNRIQRIVADSAGNGKRGEALRRRMAEYLAARHARLFPEAGRLSEVRFVAVSWATGGREWMRNPPGRWRTF